jgi:hypothetical protein
MMRLGLSFLLKKRVWVYVSNGHKELYPVRNIEPEQMSKFRISQYSIFYKSAEVSSFLDITTDTLKNSRKVYMMPILNIIRKCQRDGRYGRYRRPSEEQTERDIRPAHLSHPLYYRLLLESAQAGDTSRKHPGTLHSCWDNAPTPEK